MTMVINVHLTPDGAPHGLKTPSYWILITILTLVITKVTRSQAVAQQNVAHSFQGNFAAVGVQQLGCSSSSGEEDVRG